MTTPIPKTPHRILGVLCDVKLDENGFVDVTVTDDPEIWKPDMSQDEILQKESEGAIFPPEWIVRGALTEEEAIRTAEAVIRERRKGFFVRHDQEGRILRYKLNVDGEEWKD
jgi:hypothetical protein